MVTIRLHTPKVHLIQLPFSKLFLLSNTVYPFEDATLSLRHPYTL